MGTVTASNIPENASVKTPKTEADAAIPNEDQIFDQSGVDDKDQAVNPAQGEEDVSALSLPASADSVPKKKKKKRKKTPPPTPKKEGGGADEGGEGETADASLNGDDIGAD